MNCGLAPSSEIRMTFGTGPLPGKDFATAPRLSGWSCAACASIKNDEPNRIAAAEAAALNRNTLRRAFPQMTCSGEALALVDVGRVTRRFHLDDNEKDYS